MNAHIEKARFLYNQRRYQLAADELTHALAKTPEDPEANSLYALALAKLGRTDEALAKNTLALSKAPDNAQLHYRSCFIWQHAGHLTNAIAAVREAIRLNPRNPDYYDCLARIRYDQGLCRDTIDLTDQSLAIDPGHIDSLHIRANAQIRLRRLTEAAATTDLLLKLAPNNPAPHSLRGWLDINHNNPKRAEQNFLEALRIDPEYAGAQEGLARARREKNPLNRLTRKFGGKKNTIILLGATALVTISLIAATTGAHHAPPSYTGTSANYPYSSTTSAPNIPFGSIVVIVVFVVVRLLRKNK